MAAKRGRKPSTKKKQNNTRKKTVAPDRNISVVIMIMISILLGILIYQKTGYIGQHLSPILGGVLGWIKYIIPIGVFVLAISYACDKNNMLGSKVFEFVIFIICICAILSTYQISEQNISLKQDISKSISESYKLGTNNKGGGAIGTIIAVPLVNMIGVPGTVVLCIGISVIILVFMLGIPVSDIIQETVENMQDRKQARKEEVNQNRQKEYERRERQREERRKNRKLATFEVDAEKDEISEDQIKINLNTEKTPKLRKYDHSNDDLEPLVKGNKKKEKNKENEFQPDYIESNLFKKEEEKKEEKTKEVLTLEHAMSAEDENYEFPPITLLKKGTGMVLKGGKKALTDTANKLQKTLYSFGVTAKVENVSVGPAITRYEIKPAEGVRVSKIANLADDIALNLAAESIRIEAPIPGKQAVGIEIPNKENEIVHLRDILETDKFIDAKSKLTIALGKDVAGEAVMADIGKMPHVLIAGSTGSGKSVCINTLITSIIYKSKPSEVKLVMVDPKIVELSVYNGIPHLLIPVVTDPKKAAGALAWAVQEMENRYSMFAAKEVEESICRLAQKARAAGMHLVIATQRPSVDVVTGLIKANVPSRIAFAVSSQVDSRTILDQVGAEKLLGKGDMLFFPTGAPKPVRIQGAFISDKEVEKLVNFVKANGETTYRDDITEYIEKANTTDKEIDEGALDDDETDPLLNDAIETAIETGQASTSFIQRRFKVGYARAGRIIDQMEERGIISGYQGSKPREVLMTKERWEELNS